jgi:hypothetical protein
LGRDDDAGDHLGVGVMAEDTPGHPSGSHTILPSEGFGPSDGIWQKRREGDWLPITEPAPVNPVIVTTDGAVFAGEDLPAIDLSRQNHPFQHPDPVRAQAARDAAKPMAPREGEGELVLYRDGTRSNENVDALDFSGYIRDDGWFRKKKDRAHPLDIIAAVDPATGAVTRTADGEVAEWAGNTFHSTQPAALPDDSVMVRKADLAALEDAACEAAEVIQGVAADLDLPECQIVRNARSIIGNLDAAMRRIAGETE